MVSSGVAVVGTSAVDLIIPSVFSNSKRHPPALIRPGGGCRNMAALMASSGLDVTLYSVVGPDAWGTWLEQVTSEWKVKCKFVRFEGIRTPTFVAFLGEDGEVLEGKMFDGGCFDFFDGEFGRSLLLDSVSNNKYIVASTDIRRSLLEILTQRRIHGSCIVLTVNGCDHVDLLDWLNMCDYTFLNVNQLALLSGHKLGDTSDLEPILKELAARTSAGIVCTGGKQGLWFVDSAGAHAGWQPAIYITGPIRSTLGAGDALVAGVLLGLSRGLALGEAVMLGATKAASVLSHLGALPHNPPQMPVEVCGEKGGQNG